MNPGRTETSADALVVGAGPAGLSAGLILGRARLRALLVDRAADSRLPAGRVRGLLTRDGTPRSELLALSRAQLEEYPSIRLEQADVVDVRRQDGVFLIELSNGSRIAAETVLLAYGVVNNLPDIRGLRDLWGVTVFHCAFCHGWEVRGQPLALCANGDESLELAQQLLGWTNDLIVCTNGPAELAPDQVARLHGWGVVLREDPMVGIEPSGPDACRIEFAEGVPLERRAVFLRPEQRPSSALASRLRCETTASGRVLVNEMGETSVAGIYAAGDLASDIQQVVVAAASGAAAAMGIVRTVLAARFP